MKNGRTAQQEILPLSFLTGHVVFELAINDQDGNACLPALLQFAD